MYLIKEIRFDPRTEDIRIKDGTRIKILGESNARCDIEYWGKINFYLDEHADFSEIPAINNPNKDTLSYVNEYEVRTMGDGLKALFLKVSKYDPENREGYIIFCHYTATEVRTSGRKIWDYKLGTSVIVLKDGEYLEYKGRKIEVINKRLVMFF